MLEDKRVCPHCRRVLHTKPYLMASTLTQPVLSWAWALVAVSVLVTVCLVGAQALGS